MKNVKVLPILAIIFGLISAMCFLSAILFMPDNYYQEPINNFYLQCFAYSFLFFALSFIFLYLDHMIPLNSSWLFLGTILLWIGAIIYLAIGFITYTDNRITMERYLDWGFIPVIGGVLCASLHFSKGKLRKKSKDVLGKDWISSVDKKSKIE